MCTAYKMQTFANFDIQIHLTVLADEVKIPIWPYGVVIGRGELAGRKVKKLYPEWVKVRLGLRNRLRKIYQQKIDTWVHDVHHLRRSVFRSISEAKKKQKQHCK